MTRWESRLKSEATQTTSVEPLTDADETARGPRAAPIVSNVPGSFAWSVLHDRHPALITKLRHAFPYGPDRRAALDHLLKEITAGRVEPLNDDAHDAATWRIWGRDWFGQGWYDVPFLWAESYFYRKLLDAVGYFGASIWRGVDLFEPFKNAELTDAALDGELAQLDHLPASPRDRADVLLRASLWGNRADLGFRLSAAGEAAQTSDLVADDSTLLWSSLATSGVVCVVADNAGRELLPDLVLIDHLLETTAATHVVLHVKPYPYYVSDAMKSDVLACLRRLVNAPGTARDIGRRLWRAMEAGYLAVRTHPFYCAPLSYHYMPDDLAEEYASATLTIMKGDLNYRRLVGDCDWPATASFSDLTAYFPGPVAALRTLKSDVVVGLTPDTQTSLDASGQAWRTSGTHALVQARG